MAEARHWTSQEKNAFRRTVAWIKFRMSLLKVRKARCELCGSIKKSAKALDLHHVFPDEYDNLDPNKFKFLCTTCHEFIEFIAVRIAAGGVPNLEALKAWAGDFIPRVERKYGFPVKK